MTHATIMNDNESVVQSCEQGKSRQAHNSQIYAVRRLLIGGAEFYRS
jgi:hypothetical protein